MKKIKTLVFIIFSLFLINSFLTGPTFAADPGEFDSVIGSIDIPKGVDLISEEEGSGSIGILLFISKLIKVLTVIASIWVVINIILAAFQYLGGGGKADNNQKVNSILTSSVIGLLVIVATYTIAGLIGLIFFGDATYIINPVIEAIPGS